ncbi:chitosanase [Actinoplanes lutulentus]|uniref:Chitosanase n=1 Tax=Actinoplanes lutulentus TaxID=1287878 RepID=A0A327Z8A7_9ACTN|nr:chitosanase [Actinoplanes lutulentus]MBB2946171.1 chitosanase [Actinoplanes lutulentus]RAK32860.1 chitosanase [Actinoplanes lutulentus]
MRFRVGSFRSFTLAGGIAAVLCVPPAVSVAAIGGSADVVISQGRPALASSAASVAWTASAVADGDGRSRWTSGAGVGTQWVQIDLGAAQEVRRVRLSWAKVYAKAYRLQLSDNGSVWKDLYRTGAGNGGTDDVFSLHGSGRFLRLLATQRSVESGGYSLWEMRAYGPGPSGPVTESGRRPSAAVPGAAAGLSAAQKKETALKLVASAENSTLNWRASYGYIEDIGDGRGYTGGLVGFTSGTADMLGVVAEYTRRKPSNKLARYLPALRSVNGSDSHSGLGSGFTKAWKASATDSVFRGVQEDARDRTYFDPAVRLAQTDGLRALGQFAYYDAAVMHGPDGMRSIRSRAARSARTPAQGGDEIAYLTAFLNARSAEMRTEEAHSDLGRVETAQRVFLRASNLDLTTPLTWRVYGDRYTLDR